MIVNRYPGKCQSCGIALAQGDGFAYKNGYKWFSVCKSSACHRRLGVKAPVPEAKRERKITENGFIIMPYDRDAIPLIKSLPGARWDKPNKRWSVSIEPKDLPRVLEVCDQIRLDVPDLLRKQAAEGTTDSNEALERAERLRTDGKALFPFQKKGVEFLALHDRALLADDMGLGKQQSVDTLVLTPNGTKTIGSLSVGDYVIGSDGNPTMVTGVFPQGVKPSYAMVFSDGVETESGPDHLWAVEYYIGGRRRHRIVVTTDQIRTGAIIETQWPGRAVGKLDLSKTRLYLPMLSSPVNFDPQNTLTIPPYTMGALLGNGYLTGSTVVLTVNTLDKDEFKSFIDAEGINVSSMRIYDGATKIGLSGMINAIRELEVNVPSPQKRIPERYFFSSPESRIALLQGLMDTDGSCSKTRNRVIFHSTSIGLAQDVRRLVLELGGLATINEYDRTKENKPIEYQVRVKLPSGILPFRIARKAERYSPENRSTPTRSIKQIKYVRDVESVCISVAAPDHLYVCADGIVTHNTVQSLVALPEGESAIVICPAAVKYNWRDEIHLWRSEYKVTICNGNNNLKLPDNQSQLRDWTIREFGDCCSCEVSLDDQAGLYNKKKISNLSSGVQNPSVLDFHTPDGSVGFNVPLVNQSAPLAKPVEHGSIGIPNLESPGKTTTTRTTNTSNRSLTIDDSSNVTNISGVSRKFERKTLSSSGGKGVASSLKHLSEIIPSGSETGGNRRKSSSRKDAFVSTFELGVRNLCPRCGKYIIPVGEIVIVTYNTLPAWLKPTKDSGKRTQKGDIIKMADLTKEQAEILNETTVIADECFPGNTKVLTDQGVLKIGEIVEQALPVKVYSHNGYTGEWKNVIRWIKKPLTNKLVKVVHEFGEFICTENHKVWTTEGYTEAKSLCGKVVRVLPSFVSNNEEGQINSQILFSELFCKKLEFKSCYQGKDWCSSSKTFDIKAMRNLRGELFYSISRETICKETSQGPVQVTTSSVSGGYCSSRFEACNRGGWQDSQTQEMEVFRSKKNFSFRSSRVDSVEILERGSNERSSDGTGQDFVYDLEVEDNHNYLANGVLVSNCHLVKNYKAARSQKVTQLARACKRVWFMTGTPLMNRPQDLFGVLQSGDMHPLGGWYKFVQLFNGYKNQWGGYEFGMPQPEVPERMKRVMLRRLKTEVLKDLPPKTYQTLEVNNLGSALKKRLDKFTVQAAVTEGLIKKGDTADVLKDLDKIRGLAAKLEMTALPNFTEFSEIRALLAQSRIPAMLEEVESYEETDTPLIVFSAHKAPIEELAKRDGWEIITGDTDPETRRNIVQDFQNGRLKGVGLTIKAGGVGLTLTRASHALFVDLDWTPALNIQAEDRIARIGQTSNKVLIKRMSSTHPLDQHMQKLIEHKVELAYKALEASIQFKPIKPRPLAQEQDIIEETDEELAARIQAAEDEANREIALGKLQAIAGREAAKVNDVPEPELTPGRKAMLREALDYMVGRCDGAIERDGMGFNRPDAFIGHWLYATGLRDDDELPFRVLERILVRYRRQFKENFEAIWKPDIA